MKRILLFLACALCANLLFAQANVSPSSQTIGAGQTAGQITFSFSGVVGGAFVHLALSPTPSPPSTANMGATVVQSTSTPNGGSVEYYYFDVTVPNVLGTYTLTTN